MSSFNLSFPPFNLVPETLKSCSTLMTLPEESLMTFTGINTTLFHSSEDLPATFSSMHVRTSGAMLVKVYVFAVEPEVANVAT